MIIFKHFGRGIASLAVCVSCAIIAYFIKDGCVPSAALVIAIFVIWVDVD